MVDKETEDFWGLNEDKDVFDLKETKAEKKDEEEEVKEEPAEEDADFF